MLVLFLTLQSHRSCNIRIYMNWERHATARCCILRLLDSFAYFVCRLPTETVMSGRLPLRLLGHADGEFFMANPATQPVDNYGIISHTWGKDVAPYSCGIQCMSRDAIIHQHKLRAIKRLGMPASCGLTACA